MMLLAFGLVMLSGTVIVHASIEPKVRETSVILYTDDEPYIFHFTNLMPDAQVTYTSSKESVLIIKNSQAVPVKPGKATVTINIKQDDEKYQIKVNFKVKKVPAQKKTKDYDKLAAKAAKKLNKDAVKKSVTLGIKDSDYIHSKLL